VGDLLGIDLKTTLCCGALLDEDNSYEGYHSSLDKNDPVLDRFYDK